MLNIIMSVALTSGSALPQPSTLTEMAPAIAGVPSSAVDDGWLRIRTTAYTHTESDHTKYGRKTAAGGTLKFGTRRSAAADWSKFPLGTEFTIKGDPNTYVVDDYGSALVGKNTIDLYRPSRSSMNKWGCRHVAIRVTKWGCFEKSHEIMRHRTRNKHVRRMVNAIRARA
jgi:3D (Asp-Asp-Asp) domain-containing protein